MPKYSLTIRNKRPIDSDNERQIMHNIPIDFIAACVGTLAVLQGLSIFLTSLETAAKRIEGRSTWIAKDGTVFEEFAVSELQRSQIMQEDFKEIRAEVLLAGPLNLPATA